MQLSVPVRSVGSLQLRVTTVACGSALVFGSSTGTSRLRPETPRPQLFLAARSRKSDPVLWEFLGFDPVRPDSFDAVASPPSPVPDTDKQESPLTT